jgi:hypothetical protein
MFRVSSFCWPIGLGSGISKPLSKLLGALVVSILYPSITSVN